METFGNMESMKSAIEKKYSSKIKEIEKERDAQLAGINKQLSKELELIRSHMQTEIEAEANKMHSMVLSSEKLKAKKEFEEKREALLDKVFIEAIKKAYQVAHTKDYVAYVKKNMPKGASFVVKGDSPYFKKAFHKLKIDKKIVGIRFESADIVYDFTLDNIISSKKDILRQEVSRILFD
jgi:vacuolar-type H+-ATPase subunit E/Vma4